MFKKFVAALAVLFAATAFAAVDANKATQAELEAVKGIGPAISANIIAERKKSEYKDWTDLVTRVKGVGDRSAANFSAAGLTVNGKGYPGAPVATATAAPAPAKTAATATPPSTTSEVKAKNADKTVAKAEKTAAASAPVAKADKADKATAASAPSKTADKAEKVAAASAPSKKADKAEKATAASAAAKASAPAKK